MLFGKVLDISLLEILGWFIDVNLAIVYVLTNFFIKRIVKINCHLYNRQLNNQIFWAIKNKQIFVKLIYHKHQYVR